MVWVGTTVLYEGFWNFFNWVPFTLTGWGIHKLFWWPTFKTPYLFYMFPKKYNTKLKSIIGDRLLPYSPSKLKFFIYVANLLKLEKEHFHIFTNNNWDWNLDMVVSFSQFFIFRAFLIKFESIHFHMFTINK